MGLGDRERVCSHRSAALIAFSVLAPFVVLTGCSHDSGSRIRVELRDSPESKPAAQNVAKETYPCPEAVYGDTNGHLVSPEGHSVKLSWNPSTSSTGPNDVNILYCHYRTEEGPVQKNNTKSKSLCLNCKRVTKFAVRGTTTDPDGDVGTGHRYCYVAVAIDVRSKIDVSDYKKISDFSNQAAAVIPPPPPGTLSCVGQANEKQGDRKNHRGRR